MTEKRYYENQYLKTVNAKVVEKIESKGKFVYKFDQTIFYPEGGGQPSDKGWINGIEVIDVYSHGDDVCHVLTSEVASDSVEMELDWDFRYETMQSHLGQHILSAVLEKVFERDTTSVHFGKTCSIDVVGDPSHIDFKKLEALCNEEIRKATPVTCFFPTKEELKAIFIEEGKRDRENMRIVRIDDLEDNPCGGLHPRSTAEVQFLKILHVENAKGSVRIHYVCGTGAIRDFEAKHNSVVALSQKLSRANDEVVSGVESLQVKIAYLESKVIAFENEKVENTIAKIKADFSDKVIKTVVTGLDVKRAGNICSHFANQDGYKGMIVFELEDRDHLIVFKSKDITDDIRGTFNEICTKYGLRGGGNNFMLQAGSKDRMPVDEVLEMF